MLPAYCLRGADTHSQDQGSTADLDPVSLEMDWALVKAPLQSDIGTEKEGMEEGRLLDAQTGRLKQESSMDLGDRHPTIQEDTEPDERVRAAAADMDPMQRWLGDMSGPFPYLQSSKLRADPWTPQPAAMFSNLLKREASTVGHLTTDTSSMARKHVRSIIPSTSAPEARTRTLYQATPHADGLFHCPFEGQEGCNHKPTNLKCDYE